MQARREQMFPALTDAEIARVRRFGTPKHYRRGERLFAAGERGPGMFVVLSGAVASVSVTAWVRSSRSSGKVADSSLARLHNSPAAPR